MEQSSSSSYSVQINNDQSRQVQLQIQGNKSLYSSNGNGNGNGVGRFSTRHPRKCSYCCENGEEGGGGTSSSSSSCPMCRQHQEMEDNNLEPSQLRAIKVEPAATPGTIASESVNNISLSIEQHQQQQEETPDSKDVKKLRRKWEYFPGKNKFYCNGRLMTAPSIRFFIMCLGLIVFTFSLFIIFDGRYLGEKISITIPIVGSILFLSVIVNMIRTSCTDPGILPRASQQESEYMDKLYATNNQVRPPPRTKDIVVNGQTMKSKYCFTCKMFRPPRASHCGVCDNCVDRFDHHCPFLGNCIGKRNYSSFYAFVVSLCLLSVFILSCSVAHLVLVSKEKNNFLDALKESPTSAVVVVISFFGMWTVFGLAGFHTYLIAVEQTTNEDIKGIFGKSAQKNPFSKGNFCNNCCFVLCGPIQPSLVDARGIVTTDFLLSLPKKHEQNAGKIERCSNLQNSIRTGPHCVETQPSGGLKSNQQLPLMTSQQHQVPSYPAPYPQQQYTQVIPQDPPLERISPTPLQSSEISKTDSAFSPSGSSLNRTLPEISESLKNLYYSSIEEDPEEQDERNTSTTMTITPEPVPLSRLRRGVLNDQFSGHRGINNGYHTDHYDDDDFDDPTVLHRVSASLDRVSYDDMDDPIPASASISGASVKSNNRKSTGKRSTKKSSSSVTTPSSSVSERSSVKLRTSLTSSNMKQQQGSTEFIGSSKTNSNSMRHKSGDGKNTTSNGSASKAKRMTDSTMINSPLHLDPIM